MRLNPPARLRALGFRRSARLLRKGLRPLLLPLLLPLRLGRARRISHDGTQRLHSMAGTHDEAPDGAESCRRRAERFDIIVRYRILLPLTGD